MFKYIFAIVCGLFIISCNSTDKSEAKSKEPMEHKDGHNHGHHADHNQANKHMHSSDIEDLIARFEGPERDAYQQPEKVMEFLGDVDGEKIMEIGSGTGYFSFRLANAGAHVIAADVDDQFQEFIKNKKDSLGLTDDQLQLRKVPYDSPSLEENEVNRVLIVNTYHHIEDRSAYFSKVKNGLKEGGELIVIDFYKKEIPVGPPVEMKFTEEQVVEELKEAGFSKFDINDSLLEYQYIIRAN